MVNEQGQRSIILPDGYEPLKEIDQLEAVYEFCLDTAKRLPLPVEVVSVLFKLEVYNLYISRLSFHESHFSSVQLMIYGGWVIDSRIKKTVRLRDRINLRTIRGWGESVKHCGSLKDIPV